MKNVLITLAIGLTLFFITLSPIGDLTIPELWEEINYELCKLLHTCNK